MAAKQAKLSFQFVLAVMVSMVVLTGVYGVGAAQQLAKDQILRFAVDAADASTFEPHRVGGSQDKTLAHLVFSGLFRFPPGNEIDCEPDVATSWEVSADKRVWTFYLRKGVFFHPFPGYPSGYELTSEDVVYSLKRAADPKYSAAAGDYRGLQFEAKDRYTVKVTTEKPISQTLIFPKLANLRGGFIVCKKAIEEKGEEWAKLNPIGTGPFMFKSYEPRQKTVLVQNKKYFRGAPILTEVVIRYMPLISSRELGLQSGELDLIEGIVDSMWVDKMNSIPGVKAIPYGPAEVNVLHVNMTKAPFNDIRVRKALAYAISRQEIANFQGEKIAVPLYAATLAPPAPGALTKEEGMKAGVVYDNDIQKAKELLAEAGYPKGFKFEAVITEMSSYKQTMVAVQAQLKKAGIDMDLKVVDHPSFHSLIRKDASPLVDYSTWRPNVDVSLNCFFHSDAVVVTGKAADVNFSHFTAGDDLIEKAKYETDPQKQIALWKEAQIKILKDVAVVPLKRIKVVFAVRSYVDLGHPATWMWTNSNCQVAEKTAILAH